MKGIILAAGSGTRFCPLTAAISEQPLPVYNKPIIYRLILIHMLAGCRNVQVLFRALKMRCCSIKITKHDNLLLRNK